MSSITASIANAKPSPHAQIQEKITKMSNKKNSGVAIEPTKLKEPVQPIKTEGKGIKIDIQA